MSEVNDHLFCIFCDDIRHEVDGRMSVMGWIGPHMKMPKEGPLVLPKLCGVVVIQREGLRPVKQLRVTLRLEDKVIHQIEPSTDVLQRMQEDSLREAEALKLKGLNFKFGLQMQFFRVDAPSVLRAYAEIDGKPELQSQGLRFIR